VLPHNVTAVVARNEIWTGICASEPYECGWAREAVIFVRALRVAEMEDAVPAQVQISPDGIHWADEGTILFLPTNEEDVAFARVTEFGGWLRVAADIPDGAEITVLVTLHLKA
jgi:hypothetical protein